MKRPLNSKSLMCTLLLAADHMPWCPLSFPVLSLPLQSAVTGRHGRPVGTPACQPKVAGGAQSLDARRPAHPPPNPPPHLGLVKSNVSPFIVIKSAFCASAPVSALLIWTCRAAAGSWGQCHSHAAAPTGNASVQCPLCAHPQYLCIPSSHFESTNWRSRRARSR